MMKFRWIGTRRAAAAVLLLIAAMHASAQTCATPIAAIPLGSYSGNTCNNSTHLPALANGAIVTNGGGEDVYHISGANLSQVSLILQPGAGVDLALFVCPNQCSTYATCIAAVDNGGAGAMESVLLSDGPGDYYVVVASVAAVTPNCGSYNLFVQAPVGANR